MSENYQYINDTGVMVPDTSEILTDVQGEFQATWPDLNVDPSTPQGVLITAETLARDAVVRNNAAIANQINPNIAGGVYLDAICALTGLQRTAASQSYVLADLTGVSGTIVPEGVRVQTAAGDVFRSSGPVVIQNDGTASVAFESVEYGPIPALAGELTQIIDGVLGWETITNASSAIIGENQQSDAELRTLRKNTLALYGVSLTVAQTSALYGVPGVKSLTYRENVTNAAATIDGVTLAPHSVYACVAGGTTLDVATALLANKSAGADWNGATSVDVVEPASGQTYTVKFDRPTSVPIMVRATVKIGDSLVNASIAVRDALVNYANGLQADEVGFTVGADVSSFELAGAINREYPSIYVQKVEISTVAAGSYSTNEIVVAINEIATLSASNIVVNIVT